MSDEEKTAVEETKTVEETKVEEKAVEEVKAETKVKTDVKGNTKAAGDYPVTYEEVMDFIERHGLPEGLALGESMTIVLDQYRQGSKTSGLRFIVFGMGRTTDADFGMDDPTVWVDELTRALHVGDVATGVVYQQSFGGYKTKNVEPISYWLSITYGLPETCITYFGLMAFLCALEKDVLDDVGTTFTVSDVGCPMPLRDRQCFHLGIVDGYWV